MHNQQINDGNPNLTTVIHPCDHASKADKFPISGYWWRFANVVWIHHIAIKISNFNKTTELYLLKS